MKNVYDRTRYACYYSYLSMSSVFCLPSLLFVTFHESYGVSYTLLGTLILINFCTQLTIDLIFTFFSKYFNIKKVVTVMPLLTSAGLFLYALLPLLFPSAAYLGLAVGTVLFSVSAGLSEVLLSPIIAALPSDNPDRDMTKLHSLYAWGVVMNVAISTVFLRIFGTENWMYLAMILALLPIGACILFAKAEIPDFSSTTGNTAKAVKRQTACIALCVACIFLGSAAENVMTNWISGFMESALGISKNICDIIGIAVFAVLLGTARSLYAKYGKNIMRVLFIGMAGSAICYAVVGLCGNVIVSAVACILVGAFTSLLWPGSLSMMEENMPSLGVAAYALMAAGGDFGASIAPQLTGAVADMVAAGRWAADYASSHGLTPDQIGLRCGMLVTSLFPLIGIVILIILKSKFRQIKNQN